MYLQNRLNLSLLLALFFVLCACATRPPANLLPTGVLVEGGTEVNVLTVSTRAPSSVPGQVFSGERGDDIRFHKIGVSVPPNHVRGSLEWPSENQSPGSEFSVISIDEIEENDASDWFASRATKGRLLLFVHGYNVRYSDAVYRLAQITHDLGTGAAPVLFTWPSRGTLTSYIYDKESATYSRDALEEILSRAEASPDVHEVIVLAHSMGTWLTMEALRQSAIRNGKVDSKISNVILAAPDIDRDVFDQQFAALGEERPYFTFVVSNDDRALRLSELLGGQIDRIGAFQIEKDELELRLSGLTNVTVLDLSELDVGGSMHHSKFAESADALDIMASTLNEATRQDASESIQDRPSRALLITLSRALDRSINIANDN